MFSINQINKQRLHWCAMSVFLSQFLEARTFMIFISKSFENCASIAVLCWIFITWIEFAALADTRWNFKQTILVSSAKHTSDWCVQYPLSSVKIFEEKVHLFEFTFILCLWPTPLRLYCFEWVLNPSWHLSLLWSFNLLWTLFKI